MSMLESDWIFYLARELKLLRLLSNRGYIQYMEQNPEPKDIILSQKSVEILKNINKYQPEESCTDWIEDYRQMFSYTNCGTPGKMGDKETCINKMNDFIKKYEYSKEVILAATKEYIQSTNNSKYLKQADNFIRKREEGTKESDHSLLKV